MKTNKLLYLLCFLICFTYFSSLLIININEVTLEKMSISTFAIYLIGIIGMPKLMYDKIISPFLE